jgi:lysophospholipase L1-like esterase
MGKKKKIIFYITSILFIISFPIMLGELLVRLLSPYGVVAPEMVCEESIEFMPSLFARSVVFPKERVIKKRDGVIYHINKYGYRGRIFTIEKPEDTVRIVFLGGSHVFDIHASEGKDWPHLVENYLKEDGFKNVEVINGGVPGYASWDALGILYSEIHNFQPDYILVCNAWNDIKYFRFLSPEKTLFRNYKPIEGKNPFMHYTSWLDKLLCSSQLYVRLRYRYYAHSLLGIGKDLLSRIGLEGRKPEGEYTSKYGKSGIKQYKLNLETIVDVSRNIGAVPILLTQVRLVSELNTEEDRSRIKYEYQLLNHDALVRAFNKCDETVRRVAEEKEVYLIDLSKRFTGKSDLFHDHAHLTSKGSRTIAKEIAGRLNDLLRKK